MTLGMCIPCVFGAPFLILGAPIEAGLLARDNARARKSVHASALDHCQRPAILEAELGPDHPDLARSLRDLGVRYAAPGRLDQAEALHRRALDIRERALPERHPDIAESLEAVAALLRQSDRIEEAEALEAHAKTIREDQEGQARATGRFSDFARTLVGRGFMEATAGNLATAEAHYRRALAIQESGSGVSPEDLRRTLLGYAELLREVGRPAEADELEARAAALEAGPASVPPATLINSGWIVESLE